MGCILFIVEKEGSMNQKEIMLYGQEIDCDCGDIKVIKFKNTNTERFVR